MEAEKVLVAIGRAPRTDNVGLEKTKIKPDRGFIPVNEWMETAEPGVYAIGDIVAGLPQLAHAGSMEGMVVAAKLAGKYARPVKKNRVPGCTFVRASTLCCEAAQDTAVYSQIDGELACRPPLMLEAVPDALTLLVPAAFLAREQAMRQVVACA